MLSHVDQGFHVKYLFDKLPHHDFHICEKYEWNIEWNILKNIKGIAMTFGKDTYVPPQEVL